MHPIDQGSELASIDEQGVAAPIAEAPLSVGRLALGQEPEAHRNLGAVEELAGQGHHAVHQIGLDQGLADLAFAALVGAHAAVGQHKARHALRCQMVEEVLHPGEVGVALGRHPEFPADVVIPADPVGIVERRIGDHIIGPQIGMQIAAEGVGMLGAKVGLDAADRQVHHRQPARGGVALLAVDRDVAQLAAVAFHKLFALHEHAAGAAAGVIDAALVGLQHLHQAAHHTARRVELAAVLALG